MKRDMLVAAAALSAAVAIGAGAFGAHAAKPAVVGLLKTGALYQMIHAVAAIALAPKRPLRQPAWLLIGASCLFAASLYALALGAPRWTGAITPFGGAGMILGWLWIALGRNR